MPETRHFCPHCEENVSLSTIHRHKQLYYNARSHTWTKSTGDEVSSDSDQDDGGHDSFIDMNSPVGSLLEGIITLVGS